MSLLNGFRISFNGEANQRFNRDIGEIVLSIASQKCAAFGYNYDSNSKSIHPTYASSAIRCKSRMMKYAEIYSIVFCVLTNNTKQLPMQ
jgi:hypothetical protein